METKEWLPIVLSSTVIATCVTTLLSPVLEWIKSKIEESKIESERRYSEKIRLKQKREDTYIDAINLIQLIKRGFNDRVAYQVLNGADSPPPPNRVEELNRKIQEVNDLSKTVVPLMKMYSTDEIYIKFSELNKYCIFSYSKKPIDQFALYTFDRDFSYMCKKMQESLGNRFDEIKLPIAYRCLNCGVMHNAEEDCPQCGMDWVTALDFENKFIEEAKTDGDFRTLWEKCESEGIDPRNLLEFPLNVEMWKQKMKSELKST